MTILAITREYLVEFEAGYLTISRYADGHCKAWKKSGIASDFRSCLRSGGADKTVSTYLLLLRCAEWEPLYKPHRMPGSDPEWDKETSAQDEIAALPMCAIGVGVERVRLK
jgi:hypothetical protein